MADLHERLLAATGPLPRGRVLHESDVNGPRAALRAVVELHAPREGRCSTCVQWCDCLDDVASDDLLAAGRAAQACTHGNVIAPCTTIQAIARELEVDGG